ncbi:hypothetical protein PRZ48_014196 [Zasmidium cellare]|uniref:Uncharacterized protein n=1 Tax=Zasmidium cellare TaxID=395010 RepID=A0ABR0E0A8_ZASCE|nr:hypothetical protein PRZ48_014196 [Zasmidium cellare]
MAADGGFILPRLMQKLPQELFDRIYDLTFKVPPGDRQICCGLIAPDWSYLKSRSTVRNLLNIRLLHVDHSSPERYARSFFSGEIHTFPFKFGLAGAEGFLEALEPTLAAHFEKGRVPYRDRGMKNKTAERPGDMWRFTYFGWNAVNFSSGFFFVSQHHLSKPKMSQHRDLPELLQTLPQELFDRIYDLTFTAGTYERKIVLPESLRKWAEQDSSKVQYVKLGITDPRPRGYQRRENTHPHFDSSFTKGMRAPDTIALFHVDRTSRLKFAMSFFGDGPFLLERPQFLLKLERSMDHAWLPFLKDVWVGIQPRLDEEMRARFVRSWTGYLPSGEGRQGECASRSF